MNLSGPEQQLFQTNFALDQAKAFSLEHKLKSRENRDELMKAAKQFEGVFIKMVMAEMDKTIERGDFLNGGPAEETFRGLLYDQIAEQIATRPAGSGIGLAEAIYRQMEKQLPPETQSSSEAGKSGGNGND